MKPHDRFVLSPDVRRALSRGMPVVALESTLVTHGLPHPDGMAAAAALEARVTEHGAVPATVGVLDGRVHVGMGAAELERLATAPRVTKLNLSNFAAHLASGGPGSTTVAATMFVASRCGIGVFATGGIGGVHREGGGFAPGDVSADLTALATLPVAVVCAGAKAILDLPQTVERLETLGVPVLGFGTDAFPAFYRRDSGLPVDRRCDSIEDVARAIQVHRDLGFASGVVVANPIPQEFEMPRDLYEQALQGALSEAASRGIRGRDATPFLLDQMRERTAGRSVFSNRALLEHNAAVAARLARALAAATLVLITEGRTMTIQGWSYALVLLAGIAAAGCSMEGDNVEAASARDREKSKAEWKIVVEDGGTTSEMALERMDIYLNEDEDQPELFELYGTGVMLAGVLPMSGRVDYAENFDNLFGKPIAVHATGGDPRDPKTSTITVGGLKAPVVGGTITVDKISGKWEGSEGNKTLHGRFELRIPSASGERTVTGKFAVHVVCWG